MPRMKTASTVAEYAILGILSQAPAHGYRIAQRFAPGQDLGLLCPVEQSAVYALLHDLEARQLIVGRQDPTASYPPRTIFGLTDAGQRQLQTWLATPVEPLRRVRLDFLLKLFFAGQGDPPGADALMTEQLIVLRRYLKELDERLHQVDGDSLEALVLESKRVAVAGFVNWLGTKQHRLHHLSEPSIP